MLLHRIADGDEDAFATFFKQYFNELYQTMLRYTNRHEEAEDIVQAVFVRAWERKEVFRQMDNPLNWFFITARNEYLDRFRKARLSQKYQQYLSELFSEGSHSPETLLSNKEYFNLYQQAIRNLPEKQRVAFTLSREKGLTYSEIAVEMGVEHSTVKEHIKRAVKSIRTYMLSRCDGSENLFLLLFLMQLSPSFTAHSSLSC